MARQFAAQGPQHLAPDMVAIGQHLILDPAKFAAQRRQPVFDQGKEMFLVQGQGL